MNLLELLVQELPKRGGWPAGATFAVQDFDGEFDIKFGGKGAENLRFKHQSTNSGKEVSIWICDTWDYTSRFDFRPGILARDYCTAIVVTEQYEAALAASKQPEWGGDGVPEKGDLCIYRDKDEGPIETIVIASYDDGGDVVIWHKPTKGRDYSVDSLCFFEAAVNEEDNKRIRVAQAMCDLLGNGITVDEKEGYGKAWLDAYDAIAAGRIPGIRLTDDAGN